MFFDDIQQYDQKQLFETLFSNTETGIILYDREMRYLYWNRFMENLTGMNVAEVIGRSAVELFPHLLQSGIDTLIREALDGRSVKSGDTPFHVPGTDRHGWYIGEYSPMFNHEKIVVGAIGIIHDITLRKRAEQEKEDNAMFLQGVLNAVDEGISVLDRDLNILLVNQAVKKHFPDKDTICGEKCHKIYHERQSICPWCPSVEAIRLGVMHREIVPFPSLENPRRWFRISASPLRDSSGRIAGVVEHVLDITEQKAAREKLEAHHEFLQLVIESMPYPFYVIDVETYDIILGNSKTLPHGFRHGEKCYKITHNLDTPCDDTENQCPLQVVSETKQPVILEHIHYGQDGKEIFVEVHGCPVFDKKGKVVQMIEYAIDISARKKIEGEKEQLIDSLRKALEEVKTLKGIVPICMFCKKIRDDKGFWNMLEKFISLHTDAQFSHGICPECMIKHYSKEE